MEQKTLIIHHSFTALAVLIMFSRVLCSWLMFSKLKVGDFCTISAILCAFARGGMIHFVLTWGTNNISAQARAQLDFTSDEIYRRTIGSQLTIANRPVYNTYLWLQKFVLLQFFLQTFQPYPKLRRYIGWSYTVTFLATWTAAQIVGFTECNPISLYWQILPAPGTCVQAQIQLVVLGVLNILTDLMLLVLPIPTLFSLQTALRTKVPVCILCALGLFIVTITIIRLPINALHASVQANRTTWASTELLAAAIAAHMPNIWGAAHHWLRLYNGRLHTPGSRPGIFNGTDTVVSRSRNPRLDDDERPIIRSDFQVSVSSAAQSQHCRPEEGVMMNTFEASYNNVKQAHGDGQASDS